MVPSEPFMSYLATQLGYLQGGHRPCNWLSRQRLSRVSWINHVPPVCVHVLRIDFKQQLGCMFDMMDCKSSSFCCCCIVTYAILYVLLHDVIFRLYLYILNSVDNSIKYFCTNMFDRRSFYTLYGKLNICLQHVAMYRNDGRNRCEIFQVRDANWVVSERSPRYHQPPRSQESIVPTCHSHSHQGMDASHAWIAVWLIIMGSYSSGIVRFDNSWK